jgi:probable O-glycosylation ligase (exosortase A-associated)
MRDVIFTLVVLGLIPACFRRPFIGLVVFSWLAYMRAQDLTWGFARDKRWSLYIAIVTVAGFLAGKRQKLFVGDLRCWAMLVLLALVGLGILLSRNPDPVQFSRYTEFCKIVGVALFTTAVVKTREHLRVLLWVIALSLGFYGVKSGLAGIVDLGRVAILRGPGGMLADNNDFSLALGMAVPMLLHIGLSEKREILRRAFLLAVPLTVITVGLTHSRGGFLALAAGSAVLVWRSRNRVGGFALMGLTVVAGVLLAPESLKERIGSIANYEEDGSANARLKAWAVAIRMATDNPLLGVGFGKFRQHYLEYEPHPTPQQLGGEDIFVAHNSYLQIWAECGTPAVLIYLGLIAASLVSLWSVRREARRRYYASWILHYCTMFEASIATFVVGSAFLNRAHFDLFYHWVAIVLVFVLVARREMADEAAYPAPASGARRELRALSGAGFARRPERRRPFRSTALVPGTSA